MKIAYYHGSTRAVAWALKAPPAKVEVGSAKWAPRLVVRNQTHLMKKFRSFRKENGDEDNEQSKRMVSAAFEIAADGKSFIADQRSGVAKGFLVLGLLQRTSTQDDDDDKGGGGGGSGGGNSDVGIDAANDASFDNFMARKRSEAVEQQNQDHPPSFADVTKTPAKVWCEMSTEEKAPYVATAKPSPTAREGREAYRTHMSISGADEEAVAFALNAALYVLPSLCGEESNSEETRRVTRGVFEAAVCIFLRRKILLSILNHEPLEATTQKFVLGFADYSSLAAFSADFAQSPQLMPLSSLITGQSSAALLRHRETVDRLFLEMRRAVRMKEWAIAAELEGDLQIVEEEAKITMQKEATATSHRRSRATATDDQSTHKIANGGGLLVEWKHQSTVKVEQEEGGSSNIDFGVLDDIRPPSAPASFRADSVRVEGSDHPHGQRQGGRGGARGGRGSGVLARLKKRRSIRLPGTGL
jgi:hypothetical protein